MSCRCPVCTERSYDTLTPFQINRGYTHECSLCGSEFLNISKTKKGYSFKVSCFICDTVHEFSVSFDGAWNKNLITLGCPLTGIDLLYIGDKPNVYDAVSQNDNIFSSFTEALTDDDLLNELPPLFENAFKILNSLLISNHIFCPCGNTAAALKLSPNGITVMCDNCDAKIFLPVTNAADVEKLSKLDTITLK